MSGPTDRNRLADEESPYLSQHADNPVNWQPWDEQALSAARERDVPIFLSIGYSACHWCHVMAEESFEDPEIAAVLNDHFVPIKVDREERPDVDSIYMTVCQLATGRGGWPLSAWLTPDGRPFHVGTYFPPRSRQSTPGFLEILEGIREAWTTNREPLEEQADEWSEAARTQLEATEAADSASTDVGESLEPVGEAALRSADREHGGFGRGGPKFPQPVRLLALARLADRSDRETYQSVLVEALEAMASGGLYDHVGGGFHRYCVDADWTVPHFEKMLYDNALIPLAFLAGYQVTGRSDFAETVAETLAFVDRELGHEEGAFFSTLDARSESEAGEREEGVYYVWTPESVAAAVDEDVRADVLTRRFGITPAGNFEGATVPTISEDVDTIAEALDLEPVEVEEHLVRGRAALFEARSRRPAPPRDEKVLAGWNGLAIEAFAEAALVLDDESYADRALEALSFVRDTLWDGSELHRRYADGVVAVDGYLDDYAYLARAALRCHDATGRLEPLTLARDLGRAIERDFWDESAGTLYLTPADGEELLARPQDLTDQSTPSATGVALDIMLALSAFGDEDWHPLVESVLETHAERRSRSPLEHVGLCLAADRLGRGSTEITVAADRIPDEWRQAVGDRFLPNRLLTRRPPDDRSLEPWLEQLELDSEPPIWAGRDAREDAPTVYACKDRTCSPPQHDIEPALAWLDEGSTTPF